MQGKIPKLPASRGARGSPPPRPRAVPVGDAGITGGGLNSCAPALALGVATFIPSSFPHKGVITGHGESRIYLEGG